MTNSLKKSYFKLLMLLFFLVCQSQLFSQEKNDDFSSLKKHEIKIDAFDLAFLSTLDVTYERVSANSMSYGLSVFFNFKEQGGYTENFAVTPFFRFYFLNKEDFGSKGFFVEIFSKFASGNNIFLDSLFNFEVEDKKYFDAALGFSIGKKWVNKKGFTFEISLGGGRNLGLDENSPEFLFRGGFSLGYQF